MKVIIHNDDLGLTYGFTDAIKDCYKKGATTSTCIRTNGYAYKYAASLVKNGLKGIGLGLHLNITQGRAHTKEVSNREGNYKFSFFGYLLRCSLRNRKLLNDIEKDFQEQFKITRKDSLKFDHINSQDHIHMIPTIFEITCRLAKKHKIKYIRICDENYHLTGDLKKDLLPFLNFNLVKFLLLKWFSKIDRKILKKYQLKSADNFYGILQTNNMDEAAIISALKNAMKKNIETVELLAHPAFTHHKKDIKYISPFLVWYANLKNRTTERKALLSPRVQNFIKKNKIKLVSCKDL